MATQTKLQIIDADTHVLETERTWDYLEPSEQKYRPQLFSRRSHKTVLGYRGQNQGPSFPNADGTAAQREVSKIGQER